MDNQARQRQELELWQVVTPPENMKKAKGAATARPRPVNAGAVKTGPKPVNTRSGNVRPRLVNTTSANVRPRRTDTGRGSGNARPGSIRNINTVNSGARMPARAAVPAGYRNPGTRARALRRQAARRREVLLCRCIAVIWLVLLAATVMFVGKVLYDTFHIKEEGSKDFTTVFNGLPVIGDNSDAKKPEMQEDFLTVSEYNRPGTKLARVNNIFVHYTANPGTSAAQNRSYFENLGVTHERAASAHFIIGYEGEIIQCIPLEEEAYAVVDRNKDSVSIECCFIAEDGSFTQETYDSLIKMLVWLTDKYDLEAKDILRHYDCGGKRCPLYYVDHEDAWEKLLYDVEHYGL